MNNEEVYKVYEIIGEEITEWGNWYETRNPDVTIAEKFFQKIQISSIALIAVLNLIGADMSFIKEK